VNGRARRSYGQTDSGATALRAEAARRSGVLADLPVHRVDGHLQRVDHGQVVVDHLAGGGGQLQSGQLLRGLVLAYDVGAGPASTGSAYRAQASRVGAVDPHATQPDGVRRGI